MPLEAWDVFVHDVLIDTIHYTPNLDVEYVRSNLINHGGYPEEIDVVKRGG